MARDNLRDSHIDARHILPLDPPPRATRTGSPTAPQPPGARTQRPPPRGSSSAARTPPSAVTTPSMPRPGRPPSTPPPHRVASLPLGTARPPGGRGVGATDAIAEVLGPFDAHFLAPAFFEGVRPLPLLIPRGSPTPPDPYGSLRSAPFLSRAILSPFHTSLSIRFACMMGPPFHWPYIQWGPAAVTPQSSMADRRLSPLVTGKTRSPTELPPPKSFVDHRRLFFVHEFRAAIPSDPPPPGGRKTIDGVHLLTVDGRDVPVHETEFARDAVFGYTHSFLPDYVNEKTRGRVPAAAVQRLRLPARRPSAPAPPVRRLTVHLNQESRGRSPPPLLIDRRSRLGAGPAVTGGSRTGFVFSP